jgi:flagellar protein FliO/FliZ
MSLDLYWRFLLALAFVVGLIGLLAWAARRFGLGGAGLVRGKGRLAVVESTALDGKRRLVLLRRDDTEHLVLIGGEAPLLIESGIRSAAAPPSATGFASALEETAR